MTMVLSVFYILLLYLITVSGQCTFPVNLQGDWLRSRDGKILSFISSSSATGFNLESKNQNVDQFNCFIKAGSQYVLRSEMYNNIIAGTFIYIYTCYDMVAVGDDAFYIYELTERSNEISNNERGSVYSDTLTVSLTDICTLTRNDVQYTTLVSQVGITANALTYCPKILFGSFEFLYESNSCTDQSNLTACNDRKSIAASPLNCANEYFGYSANGYLLCTATLQYNSTTYVTLLNKDPSVDNTKTFRFTCLAIEQINSTVIALTQYPTDCLLAQTVGSIAAPGVKILLAVNLLCPIPVSTTTTIAPSTPTTIGLIKAGTDDTGIIVGALLAVLMVLIIILIVLLCIRHRKTNRAKVANSKDGEKDGENNSSTRETQKSAASTRSVVVIPNTNANGVKPKLIYTQEDQAENRRSGKTTIGTKRYVKPHGVEPRLSLGSADQEPDNDHQKPRTNNINFNSGQVNGKIVHEDNVNSQVSSKDSKDGKHHGSSSESVPKSIGQSSGTHSVVENESMTYTNKENNTSLKNQKNISEPVPKNNIAFTNGSAVILASSLQSIDVKDHHGSSSESVPKQIEQSCETHSAVGGVTMIHTNNKSLKDQKNNSKPVTKSNTAFTNESAVISGTQSNHGTPNITTSSKSSTRKSNDINTSVNKQQLATNNSTPKKNEISNSTKVVSTMKNAKSPTLDPENKVDTSSSIANATPKPDDVDQVSNEILSKSTVAPSLSKGVNLTNTAAEAGATSLPLNIINAGPKPNDRDQVYNGMLQKTTGASPLDNDRNLANTHAGTGATPLPSLQDIISSSSLPLQNRSGENHEQYNNINGHNAHKSNTSQLGDKLSNNQRNNESILPEHKNSVVSNKSKPEPLASDVFKTTDGDESSVDEEETMDLRKVSVISSVGPAACALISPRGGSYKKSSVTSIQNTEPTKASEAKTKKKKTKKKKNKRET